MPSHCLHSLYIIILDENLHWVTLLTNYYTENVTYPLWTPEKNIHPLPLYDSCLNTILTLLLHYFPKGLPWGHRKHHPLSSPSLPAFNLSIFRVFTNESVLPIRWPKICSFSFSICPSYEYSGLTSFRIDWFDPLTVQDTLKSLLQHHSSRASVLQCSAFLMIQLSHPYMTTGKTIALTRRTFVGKVMSLLFNMLPRLRIAFLPRNKCLLISQSSRYAPIHSLSNSPR